MKKVQKQWTKEEVDLLNEFFSKERTNKEKHEFSSKLDRTWNGVYLKYYDVKTSAKRKNPSSNKSSKSEITVTHLHKEEKEKIKFVLKIGEVVVETNATSLKINDVQITI